MLKPFTFGWSQLARWISAGTSFTIFTNIKVIDGGASGTDYSSLNILDGGAS